MADVSQIVVVRAPSELDAHNGGLFSEALREIPPHAPLVIDCADVEFADSTGLRCLIKARREHEEAGGSLRLINVGRRLRRVLQVAGLLSIFDVTPDGEPPDPSSGGPSST
jgi:anti-sigma B factor antagonist